MNNDSNVTRLAHFAEQIRQHVNEETASRYMELMRRWISGEIQMDQVLFVFSLIDVLLIIYCLV